MEKILKNDKPTSETVKSPLEVRERQNKFEITKGVRKIPMGLYISPKQFRELFLQKHSIKALKS